MGWGRDDLKILNTAKLYLISLEVHVLPFVIINQRTEYASGFN